MREAQAKSSVKNLQRIDSVVQVTAIPKMPLNCGDVALSNISSPMKGSISLSAMWQHLG